MGVSLSFVGRRAAGRVAAALTAGLLAACAPQPGIVDVGLPGVDPVGLGASRAPGLDALVLPVTAGNAAERRLLPNDTALPGENFVLTLPNRSLTGRTSIAEILRINGPMPYPFEYVIARDFAPIGGGLGFVRATPEDGVTCVLVAGTADGLAGAGRPIFMRNCVAGDAAAALAPVRSLQAF